jgi:hypothetical protein
MDNNKLNYIYIFKQNYIINRILDFKNEKFLL